MAEQKPDPNEPNSESNVPMLAAVGVGVLLGLSAGSIVTEGGPVQAVLALVQAAESYDFGQVLMKARSMLYMTMILAAMPVVGKHGLDPRYLPSGVLFGFAAELLVNRHPEAAAVAGLVGLVMVGFAYLLVNRDR